jgi:hypothetical protein
MGQRAGQRADAPDTPRPALRFAVPVHGPEPAKAVGYLAAAGIQTLTEDFTEVKRS